MDIHNINIHIKHINNSDNSDDSDDSPEPESETTTGVDETTAESPDES